MKRLIIIIATFCILLAGLLYWAYRFYLPVYMANEIFSSVENIQNADYLKNNTNSKNAGKSKTNDSEHVKIIQDNSKAFKLIIMESNEDWEKIEEVIDNTNYTDIERIIGILTKNNSYKTTDYIVDVVFAELKIKKLNQAKYKKIIGKHISVNKAKLLINKTANNLFKVQVSLPLIKESVIKTIEELKKNKEK